MLISLGVDFRRAALPVREHFQPAPADLTRAYRAVRRGHGGVVALATCNRFELTAWVPARDPAHAAATVAAAVRRLAPAPAAAAKFLALAERRYDHAAAQHLLRVAAGLESRIVGDSQILGQLRAAYQLAARHGAASGELHRLFQTALRAGRRVRNETGLISSRPSAGTVAAAWLARRLGPLGGRAILVVGAGKTAAAAARRLQALGADRLTVLNRTEERAWSLALEAGGRAAPLAELPRLLARADAAVLATRADAALVTVAQLAALRPDQATRPLVLVDLSVPRNVDPAVAGLPGVSLVDLDGLGGGPASAGANDVAAAEAVVAQELERFMAWLRAAPARTAISPLQESILAICRREVAHVAPPGAAERAAQRIAASLVAGPLAAIRSAQDRGVAVEHYTDLLRTLFVEPS